MSCIGNKPFRAVYMCYDDRWLLDLALNHYKSDEYFDKTDVRGDFSLTSSEFINFISSVLTCRMLRQAREAGLLEKAVFIITAVSSQWPGMT